MTADRTTIKAALSALLTGLQNNLVAEPPTGARPFRLVQSFDGDATSSVRPFLAVRLFKAQPIGVTDDDKVIEVAAGLQIATDVLASDPSASILDKVAAVDDYLDSLIDTGVLDGADGFDDRSWTFQYPRANAGARLATAEATQSFIVKVKRQKNREPAA